MAIRRVSLFSPAVGSKASKKKYPIDDGRHYDVIVEPFAHAGPIALERLSNFGKPNGCKNAIVSDADISVHAIWVAFVNEEIREDTNSLIAKYHHLLSAESPKVTKENLKQSEAFSIFLELKEIFNDGRAGNRTYAEVAAVSLVLRKLVFGGVIRCSKQGLNVTLSYDKLKAFSRWNHKWPKLDPACNVDLSLDWRTSLTKLANSDFKRFLILIDPPYWLPYEPGSKRRGTGSMTPAYTSHNPWDDDTYKMAVESVRICLDLMSSRMPESRIVLTNYWSEPLQKDLETLAEEYRVKLHTTELDVLVGMNKARTNRTNRIETAWEIGGERMFGVTSVQKEFCNV